MNSSLSFRVVCFGYLMAALALFTGCSSSGSMVVYGTGYLGTEPQVVIVRPFAVTSEESNRDGDILPAWILRNPRSVFQTEDDLRFGAMASEQVTNELLAELKLRGIPAVLADGSAMQAINATVLTGQFADLDTGTKWLRPEVGFTIKNGYQARVQITQHKNLAVEMAVYAKGEGVEGARDMAAQIAHQINESYALGGWGPARVK